MANLEIEGRITQKLPPRQGQGARGGWVMQDFILEWMDGNYPASACITAFGDEKVKDLGRFKVGDPVKVAFNIKGREYNGRWYNDLRMWRISAAGAAPATPPAAAPVPGPAPAPAPTVDDIPAEPLDEEDLPF